MVLCDIVFILLVFFYNCSGISADSDFACRDLRWPAGPLKRDQKRKVDDMAKVIDHREVLRDKCVRPPGGLYRYTLPQHSFALAVCAWISPQTGTCR